MIRMGNVIEAGDMRQPTPGSELIVDILLDDDPRPVFLQAWGGPNTIARALRSIEERHAGTPGWEAMWRYREAGTCPGEVTLRPIGPTAVVVELPAGARSGQTVHVIAEATDDGTPPLTRYQRVIITVGR